MNARSRVLVAAFAVAPLVVITAACGGVFAPADVTPDTEAGDATAGSDAADTGVVPVGANEDVDPDGGAQDATTRDGSSKFDAAGCTCDCDQDGFQALTMVCDGGPGPIPDCDDLDDFVKPTSGFVTGAWTSPHTPTFDWNCDGVRTKQFEYNQKCNDPTNCSGKSGFDGDPNCGASAVFNVCSYTPAGLLNLPPASCKVGSTSMVVQGCK